MGIAILSGTLTSLENRARLQHGQNSEPPSGISTPTASQFLDAPDDALPSRFIATVGREETGRKLRKTFEGMGALGSQVEVQAGKGNVAAAKEADVVLIWYAEVHLSISRHGAHPSNTPRCPFPLTDPHQLQTQHCQTHPLRGRDGRRDRWQACHFHLRRSDHCPTTKLGARELRRRPRDAQHPL